MKVESPEIIKFTFGGEASSPIVITAVINVENSISTLDLAQENNPETEYAKVMYRLRCWEGWGFYLVNLKLFLYGRYDLRNKDLAMENLINK